jgi:hypothetical protein
MARIVRCLAALSLVGAITENASAAVPAAAYLRWLPEQANAVLVIDVDGLRRSPMGVQEGWGTKPRAASTGAILPVLIPDASTLLLGAQLDPSTLTPVWEVGIVTLKRELSLSDLAGQRADAIDTVSGVRCMPSVRNGYIAELGPRALGIMAPANRQYLARWLKFTKESNTVVLTPWLQETLSSASSRDQVALAVELGDLQNPQGIKFFLKGCESLRKKRADVDRLAKLLGGTRGVSLRMRVDNSIHGELRCDFSTPIGSQGLYLKPIILEILANMGAAIPELESWTSTPEGSTLVLAGDLSEAGARRILSLLRPPVLAPAAGSPAGADQGTQDPVVASQTYFMEITRLIDDLKRLKPKNVKENALWHQKYADWIDRLPILNVDPDLLTYGRDVAMRFRALSQSLQGIYMNNRYLNTQRAFGQAVVPQTTWNIGFGSYGPAGGYYGGYGGYGGWSSGGWGPTGGIQTSGFDGPTVGVDNYEQIQDMKNQLIMAGEGQRIEVWRQIDDETSAVRQKMVAKYHAEFPLGKTKVEMRTK